MTNGFFKVDIVSTVAGKKLSSSLNKNNLKQVGVDLEDKFYSLMQEKIVATIPVTLRKPLADLYYKNASESIETGTDPETGEPYAPLTELYALNKLRYLVRKNYLKPSYPAFPKRPERLKAGARRARKGELTKVQLRAKYASAIEKVKLKRKKVREALASRLAGGDILPILVANRRMQNAIEEAREPVIVAERFTKNKPATIRFILDVPDAEYFRFHQTGTKIMEQRRIFNETLTKEMIALIKKQLGLK